MPLREVAEYLADKHRITVAIDSAKVAKGEKPFADRTINVPKMGAAPVGFLVEYLAQAAGATSRKAGDRYVIEAGKPKDLGALLTAPSPKARANAARSVTFEKNVENLPLRELLDFLREKYDTEILVDDLGFRRAKKGRGIEEEPVRVPAGETTLEKVLESVVGKLGGKVVVREEMILIVHDPKAKS
jgi:hypothetical protein